MKLEPVKTYTGRPRVVIVGGGFGGLTAARSLKGVPVDVTLIDRRNHHLFQPLLYQVATASLSPADIAQPIREILRKQKNAKVVLGEVARVEPDAKQVVLANGETVPYDYLVLAAGARHSYFGKDEWEADAPGMKSLDDALALRSKILLAFEQAELAETEEERRALLTFVIIGGGPTGVELAGAIAEIAHHSVAREFRNFNPATAKVILLEALPRILPMFPEKLSESAVKQLTEMGVTVRTGGMVTLIEPGVVHLGDDQIQAKTIVWAAGVAASPLGKTVGVPTDRAGRVPVTSTLQVEAHPEIFVIGDQAAFTKSDGKPLPGVAPVATQEGHHAGVNIGLAVAGQPLLPFEYKDRGSMATIGRNRAIAQVGKYTFSGFPAWLAWNVVHVVNLSSFRNRLFVGLRWIWDYVNYKRGARLIE